MRETVLYYCPKKTPSTSRLKAVLIQMGIRIKTVEQDQIGEKVGYLAGMEGYEKEGAQRMPEIPEEVMVLKDFSGGRMDELFARMRAAKIPKISLKAIVTETNAEWSFYQLYEEIKEEHRQMSAQSGAPVHKPQ